MGPAVDATYVGTYDWPGESLRDIQLTPGLREICVPLSSEHFDAAAKLQEEVGAGTVIDAAFAEQVSLSPEFLRVARKHIAAADVVVFTHPWCYPPLADALRDEQLVVYDSQNVETLLKAEAFPANDAARKVLRIVAVSEQALLERSHIVLACSDEDSAVFRRVFDLDPYKVRIAPNGAFTSRFPAASSVDRLERRVSIGLPEDRPVALFLGSMYGPNVEAARYIVEQLAPACPKVTFVVAGGVGQALADASARPNVVITGPVDDERRDALLLTADVALNPMFAGSGTNIKMFDYMAAGLPALTTVVGARGICNAVSSPEGVVVSPIGTFPSALAELLRQVDENPGLRTAVQRVVEQRFSWERISAELGSLFETAFRKHREGRTGGPKIAMLSTWNIACGIGEHGGYLAEALAESGNEVLIIGNSIDGHEPLGFERDMHQAAARAWVWDNKHWRDSRVDLESFAHILDKAKPDLLVVQHHTGFMPFFDFEKIVETASSKSIPVVVELHDGRSVTAAQKSHLIKLGASLVVHHQDELEGLDARSLKKVAVIPLPVRAARSGKRLPDVPGGDGPVITGFGFLRPYKGVLTAIRVLSKLRKEFPGIRYVGLHASYGGEASELHLAECRQEAAKLGVLDAVHIDTGFHSVEDVVAEMGAADVILMAYEPSSEGASAAANTALAAGRPIVVSPSAIFRPLSEVVQVVPRHEVAEYANAITSILRDRDKAEAMVSRARAWTEEHSYERSAQLFLAFAVGKAAPR
jgi:glycosyltransferase involved in cell wall biosynthesis